MCIRDRGFSYKNDSTAATNDNRVRPEVNDIPSSSQNVNSDLLLGRQLNSIAQDNINNNSGIRQMGFMLRTMGDLLNLASQIQRSRNTSGQRHQGNGG